MYPVALRDEIRTWVLIQGKSQRAAARHFGLSRNTVAKLLEEEPAPKERRYQRQKVTPKTPVRDVALPHIEGWLKENEWLQELPAQTTLDSSSHVGRTTPARHSHRRIDRASLCAGAAQADEAGLRSARLCAWGAGRV